MKSHWMTRAEWDSRAATSANPQSGLSHAYVFWVATPSLPSILSGAKRKNSKPVEIRLPQPRHRMPRCRSVCSISS